jgi:hypothetical protein
MVRKKIAHERSMPSPMADNIVDKVITYLLSDSGRRHKQCDPINKNTGICPPTKKARAVYTGPMLLLTYQEYLDNS